VTPPFDSSALSSAEKDALIARLLARIDELSKRLAAVEAENAALRDKLNLPPKTPDNSSTAPSQGRRDRPSGAPFPVLVYAAICCHAQVACDVRMRQWRELH
jgi:hypothetical protein